MAILIAKQVRTRPARQMYLEKEGRAEEEGGGYKKKKKKKKKERKGKDKFRGFILRGLSFTCI
jgi:hypothetical protein